MRPYLVLIPIFFLALIQGAFLPVNLVMLIVLFWAVVRDLNESIMVAFLSGLFMDLALGSPLGQSSIILLVATVLVRFYSRRFDPTHPLFFFVFVFLASVVFNLIFKKPWLIEGVILAVLAWLARPLIRYYHEDISHDQLKLELK